MNRILVHLLRFGAVCVAFFFLLYLASLLADMETLATRDPAGSSADEEAAGRWLGMGEKDAAPVVNLRVDYSPKSKASWYPRGESPLLAELVKSGDLPPVAQRVGREPVVMRGREGLGRYGGTWLRIANSQIDSNIVMSSRLSYASLLRFSPRGLPVVPHVARDYEVSADNRIFTFYLRRGMKWSDGHPFTADDILYFWNEEMLDPDLYGAPLPWMTVQNEFPEVSAPDPYTVRIAFPRPNGIFLYQMATWRGAQMVASARHYLRAYHPRLGDSDFIAKQMDARNCPSPEVLYREVKQFYNTEHPRLWPWIYRSYSPSGPHVYVRNPYYFAVDEAGNQLPYIDRIFYEVKSPDMVTISAAAGGTSLQARHIRFEEYTFLMSQRQRENYDIYHWYPGDRSQYLINVNVNRKYSGEGPDAQKARLFKEVDFRRALSLAINRERIIRAEYHGKTRPGQVAPGPDSPFYNPEAFSAFIEYDPTRANELLDAVGLEERDVEGYRRFPNGDRLTIYLIYTNYTGEGPSLFLVEDWAAVGIRVIPRERSRMLFEMETRGLRHDLAVWSGNGEFFPIIEPRYLTPIDEESLFALGYARWYKLGGLYNEGAGEGSPGAIEPLPGSPVRRTIEIYEKLCAWSELDKIRAAFDELLAISASQVWTINISTPPPVLGVVLNTMRNVPEDLVYSWDFQSPGNAGPETFYLSEDNNTSNTAMEIQRSILKASMPYMGKATAEEGGAVPTTGGWVQKLLAWLFGIAACCVALLFIWRNPFVLRRMLIMIPTLLIISVVVFTVIQLPPGDYVSSEIMRLRESGDPSSLQRIAELKQVFHLESSMFERYLRWMGVYWFWGFDAVDAGLLQGNLGRSMETMRPVGEVIGDRILLTLCISLGTVLFTWALAIPIGIYSAVRQYTLGDYIITFFGFIGMCIPGFLLALLLMYAGSEWFSVTVTGLFSPEYATQAGWSYAKILDLLQHIWVPVVVMGVNGTAAMIRIMRANLLDELRKPYVVTARAKGMRPFGLIMKYPVRLALNPFVSGIGTLFPQLVSGGAIVAMVLSLPTVGPLMLSALFSEDMYLAGSMLMILSLLGVVGTLVSDLLLMWLDPRIRMTGN